MGILLTLRSPSVRSDRCLVQLHLTYESLQRIRSGLRDELGFEFRIRQHMLKIHSDSNDDILWHFFTASDCEAVFANWECHHLAQIFSHLHIRSSDERLHSLVAAFQEADRLSYSLKWSQI